MVNSLNTYKFPIIEITETWLHSRSPPFFNINGYSLIRTDRKNGRGGGVAFYLNDKLKFKIRNDISIRDTETLFIEILNKQNKNIIVGLIYRPPSNPLDPFFDDLDAYIHILSTENKHIYLMGDFNIDLLSTTQTHGQRLKNLLYTYALHPHIDKPTRITNTSISSQIISATKPQTAFCITIFRIINIPIFMINNKIDISKETNDNEPNYRRIESENNIASLNSDLAQAEWQDVFSENNVNHAYDKFLHKLLFYYDKNIPLVKTKTKKRVKNPWITKGILRSIHIRNRLFKMTKTNPSVINLNKYKRYLKKINICYSSSSEDVLFE